MEQYKANIYKSAEGKQLLLTAYDQALAQWSIPVESRYVTTRHGETHILTVGSDAQPTLMLFHGWGASAAGLISEYDLKLLSQNFKVFMPDTIGQAGRSAAYRPPTTGAAYAEWIADCMDGLRIESAYVAGISGGGFLSLKAASYLPARVRGVLAVCPGGISAAFPPSLRFIVKLAPVMMLSGSRKGLGFVKALKSPHSQWTPNHQSMADAMSLQFEHYNFDNGPSALSDDELSRISAPLEMLLGEDDFFFPHSKVIPRAQRHLKNLKFEVIPNAGHILTFDCPGLVEARLMAWA